jgi:hypothetical protein
MLDSLLGPARGESLDLALAGALAQAAAAIARLDQALAGHPLLPAFLHRARLEAVRRQAAVDGPAIDPWHLAAVLEGFRLRMDGALRIVDRGAILEAARHALELHQWLVAPDFDQEGAVQVAEVDLATYNAGPPLLTAAVWLHAWLGRNGHGGGRPPARAALVRFWTKHRLLRAPVPLTGARALRAEASWDTPVWIADFLGALAGEAEDALDLLGTLERAWFAARAAVAGRRRTSRAASAVDILAAVPLVSATSLAAGLGMAVKNAATLLDEFRAAGIAAKNAAALRSAPAMRTAVTGRCCRQDRRAGRAAAGRGCASGEAGTADAPRLTTSSAGASPSRSRTGPNGGCSGWRASPPCVTIADSSTPATSNAGWCTSTGRSGMLDAR